MSTEQKQTLLAMLDEKIKKLEIKAAQSDLIRFAKDVYPNYSVGGHHKVMGSLFKEIAEGQEKTGDYQHCPPPRQIRTYFLLASSLVFGAIPYASDNNGNPHSVFIRGLWWAGAKFGQQP